MAGRIYTRGYRPPEGVDSREAVMQYQRDLGVRVDGVWGPKTEAAYQRSLERERRSENVFKTYYDMVMGSLQLPDFSVYTPSRAQIEKEVAGYLRPSVDGAIKRRREAGETNKAELDADAAARGMGRSTYVSSMKEREADDVEDDVGSLEAQYLSALSERVEGALRQYRQMQLDAERAYASAYSTASATAMGLANQYTNDYFERAAADAAAESRSRAVWNYRTVQDMPAKPNLTYEQCEEYVGLLTDEQAHKFYNSPLMYWAERRREMKISLTEEEYEKLKEQRIANGGNR